MKDKYMNKREKILLSLASLVFLLVVYLVIASKDVPLEPSTQNSGLNSSNDSTSEKIDLAEMELQYRQEAEDIFVELKKNVNRFDREKEELKDDLEKTKAEIMALRVPADYRSFHIGLIMVVDGILNGSFDEKSGIMEELQNLSKENSWLE